MPEKPFDEELTPDSLLRAYAMGIFPMSDGRDRPEALARLKRALSELIIDGIDTSIPLFHMLLAEPDIQNGEYNIHWLEKWLEKQFAK